MSEPSSELLQADLDRLVDGELPPPRLRELIERCDRRPENWRAVAVAFLEAQAVSQSLRSAAVRPQRPATRIVPAASARGRTRSVAVAVTAIVSLLVGWVGGQALAPRMPTPGPATTASEAGPDLPREPGAIAAGGFSSGDADAVDMVPIYDAADEQWSVASRESRAALERWTREQEAAGNHVEVRQWLVGLELDDGSHAVTPVDELIVRPTAREFY
jgi:hypothetical protein